MDHNISTHSLTKRLTHLLVCLPGFQFHFNSQPHEEADWMKSAIDNLTKHFNSQPHEEADQRRWKNMPRARRISTHSLTKRLTIIKLHNVAAECISTHSLTKRLTVISLPLLYRSSISTHSLTKRLTIVPAVNKVAGKISTHSLTKRLTRL